MVWIDSYRAMIGFIDFLSIRQRAYGFYTLRRVLIQFERQRAFLHSSLCRQTHRTVPVEDRMADRW